MIQMSRSKTKEVIEEVYFNQDQVDYLVQRMSHQQLRESWNHYMLHTARFDCATDDLISEKDPVLGSYKHELNFHKDVLPVLKNELARRSIQGTALRYIEFGYKFHTPEGCFEIGTADSSGKKHEHHSEYRKVVSGREDREFNDYLHWYWYDAFNARHSVIFYL